MSQVVDVGIRVRGGSVASAARRIAPRLPAIGLALLLLVNVLLTTNAIHVLRAGLAAISYPFELDFAEGLLLTATRAMADGRRSIRRRRRSPAPSATTRRCTTRWSRCWASAVRITWRWAGPSRWRVRCWRRSCWPRSPGKRSSRRRGDSLVLLAAACAGMAFLQISYTASFAALMRVDLLAVLFAFTGVLVFGATAARGRRVYWCLIPLVLALYTKQSTIAAAAGAC
jgi:hypothetical protein